MKSKHLTNAHYYYAVDIFFFLLLEMKLFIFQTHENHFLATPKVPRRVILTFDHHAGKCNDLEHRKCIPLASLSLRDGISAF